MSAILSSLHRKTSPCYCFMLPAQEYTISVYNLKLKPQNKLLFNPQQPDIGLYLKVKHARRMTLLRCIK